MLHRLKLYIFANKAVVDAWPGLLAVLCERQDRPGQWYSIKHASDVADYDPLSSQSLCRISRE